MRSRMMMSSRYPQGLLRWTTEGIGLRLLMVVSRHGVMVLGEVLLEMAYTAGIAGAVAAGVQGFRGGSWRVD